MPAHKSAGDILRKFAAEYATILLTINEKTLQDLQFPTVLETVAGSCNTDAGREKALAIVPFRDRGSLMDALAMTSEYQSSFQNNNALPNHGFESI